MDRIGEIQNAKAARITHTRTHARTHAQSRRRRKIIMFDLNWNNARPPLANTIGLCGIAIGVATKRRCNFDLSG